MIRSPDGRKLLISSLDGFCSVISFDEEELGVPCTQSTASTQVEPAQNIVINVIEEKPISDDKASVDKMDLS